VIGYRNYNQIALKLACRFVHITKIRKLIIRNSKIKIKRKFGEIFKLK
jgi:hypothetical protein